MLFLQWAAILIVFHTNSPQLLLLNIVILNWNIRNWLIWRRPDFTMYFSLFLPYFFVSRQKRTGAISLGFLEVSIFYSHDIFLLYFYIKNWEHKQFSCFQAEFLWWCNSVQSITNQKLIFTLSQWLLISCCFI